MEKTDTKPFGSDWDYFVACPYCNHRIEEGEEPYTVCGLEPCQVVCEKCNNKYSICSDLAFTTTKYDEKEK